MLRFKRILFVIFVAIFPVAVAFQLVFPNGRPVFLPAQTHGPVLIIDAGHGGEDGGAISRSGVLESHLNLAIAQRLELILGLFATPVTMLRQEDVSLHDSHCKTLREKKVSDLHNRVKLVSQQANGVLLSIHQNSFPSERFSGAQVFFAPTDGSQALANAMQTTLRFAIDPANSRQAAAIAKGVYLMNHITCPAILVECGFLTNPAEEQRLQEAAYQTKLAAAMAGCWLNYRGTEPLQDREEGIH